MRVLPLILSSAVTWIFCTNVQALAEGRVTVIAQGTGESKLRYIQGAVDAAASPLNTRQRNAAASLRSGLNVEEMQQELKKLHPSFAPKENSLRKDLHVGKRDFLLDADFDNQLCRKKNPRLPSLFDIEGSQAPTAKFPLIPQVPTTGDNLFQAMPPSRIPSLFELNGSKERIPSFPGAPRFTGPSDNLFPSVRPSTISIPTARRISTDGLFPNSERTGVPPALKQEFECEVARSKLKQNFDMPNQQTMHDYSSEVNAELAKSKRQQLILDTDALLESAKQPFPNNQVSDDLKGELARGNAVKQAQIERARTELRTVLRMLPINRGQNNQFDEVFVNWDAWHSHFNQLANPLLINSLDDLGSPTGTNSVKLTVGSDQSLIAELEVSSNRRFDRAILRAYESLNGNPELAFPMGSRRTSITFMMDNSQEERGMVSGVNSQPLKGDKELIKRHR